MGLTPSQELALAVLRKVAGHRHTVTAEHVAAELRKPPDLGPVFERAEKRGWIERDGEGAWRSRIFGDWMRGTKGATW